MSIAPAFAAIFSKTNFWIGNRHITYGNVSGLVTVSLIILLQILVVTLVSDLSREFDIKKMNECNDNNNDTSTLTWFEVIKRIYIKIDTLFIMSLALYMGYLDTLIFRVLPLIIIQNLNYGYSALNVSFTAFALMNIVELITLIKCKINLTGVYYCGISSSLSLMLIAIGLLIFSKHIHNMATNIATLALFTLFLSFFYWVIGYLHKSFVPN